MSLKSSEIHNCSWRISTALISFLVSSSCHAFLPLAIRPMRTICEIFLKMSFILQNWTAPSSSRCTSCAWRRRWINFFDVSKSESDHSRGSVQILFSIGTVLGEEPVGPLLCGFALAFDRHAKSFASSSDANYSSWASGTSCSLLLQIHHKLVWSMTNSDPGVRIVSVQRHNSDLNSVLTKQTTDCNFQYGPNLGVRLDPSFWLWWLFISWKSAFTTGHCMNLWNVCSVFRHEVLSNFNNIQKYLHPYRHLLNLSCCDSFSIRSPYCCNRRRSLLCQVITIRRHFCLDNAQHESGTLFSFDNRLPRYVAKGFVLFAHFSDCSVKTELICRNNFAKK